MIDSSVSKKYAYYVLLALTCFCLCKSTSYSQSLNEKIIEAKSYQSNDPEVSPEFNIKQQLKHLYELIPLVESSKHNDTIGLVYYSITYRHLILSEWLDVKKNATLSLHYFHQSDYDGYMVPYSYYRLARANQLLGYSQEAIDNVNSLFSLDLKGRSLSVITDAQRIVAEIYRDKGDHESALSQLNYFINSPLADSINAQSKAIIFRDISLSHSLSSDSLSMSKAIQAITKSQSLLPQVTNAYHQTDLKISNDMQMAYIHSSRKNYDSAIAIYKQIFHSINSETSNINIKRYKTIAIANLIALYLEIEDYDNIEKLLQEYKFEYNKNAQLSLQDSYALLNENISSYYIHKKDFTGAQQFLSFAYNYIDINENSPAHHHKANSNKQRLTKLLSNKIELNKVLFNTRADTAYLKLALEDMYRLDTIIDYVNQDLLFESSILNWRQEAKTFYNQGIDIAYTLDHHEAFWHFSEKAKSLALIESISNDKLFLADTSITKSGQQLRELQLHEGTLNQKLVETQDANLINRINKELAENKISQNTILIERNALFQKQLPAITTLTEIQLTLDNSTLLQYLVSENNIYALRVDNDQSSLHKLGSAEEIKRKILKLNQLLNNAADNTADFKLVSQLLRELNDILIQPFSDLNEELVIIPDDFLFLLPFSPLLSNHDRYLIEDHTVHFHLSGTLYNLPQETDNNYTYSSIIVSPEYTGQLYTPLISAQEESQMVHSITGGHLMSTIEKDRLITMYTQSQLFHFSGHALLNQGFRNNSFLALSDTSQLSESEIYNYPTSLKLVVLSGCDTGGGEILKGEGISNLARAFIYSGARSVLQSLWSINDQASQQLINLFYQELKKGESKSTALRQAQLNYLAAVDDFYRHPYYWSSFVLVGDDAPISFSTGHQKLLTIVLVSVFVLCLILFFFIRKK